MRIEPGGTEAGRLARRTRLLLGVLILAAVGYLLLQPQLRRIRAETVRVRQETEQIQAVATIRPDRAAAARAAVVKSPEDPEANVRLAALLSQAGDVQGAANCLKTAMSRRPDDIPTALLLGDTYERLRRHDLAIPLYQAILKRTPDQPVALNRLAWLAISYGWVPEAQALLERALRAHPDDPHLQDGLAFVYLQLREYRRAEQILLAVRKAHPAEPALWIPLGDVYAKQSRYGEAAAVRREALAFRPGDLRLTRDLAQSLFDSGDVVGAVATWHTILATNPVNLVAHYGLGVANRKLGKTPEAVQEFETVSRHEPDHAEIRSLLGQLYVQQGRSADGNALLRAYAAQQEQAQQMTRASFLLIARPQSPASHFQMARVYQKQHNIPRMAVELRKTLELDPHYALARTLLDTLPPHDE